MSVLTKLCTRVVMSATAAALLCSAAIANPAMAEQEPQRSGDIGVMFDCGQYSENKTTTRSEALARAQTWIDAGVPYSQSACKGNQHGSYRTDCSGYVSMAWGLRHSYTTATIDQVTHPIARSDLQPGDALNRAGEHVALFVAWADGARTQPIVREQAGPNGAPTKQRVWSQSYANTYAPIRYDNIRDDSPPDPPRPPGSSISGDPRAELVYNQADGVLRGWYNGNGFTTLPWTSDIPVGSGFNDPARMQFAEISGDGRKELIYVETDGRIRAWRNGNGFTELPWTEEINIGYGFSDPKRVKFADISGDGRDELIYVDPDGRLRAWYNGNGYMDIPWHSEIVIGTGFADPERVYFADLSGDGRAELIYNQLDGRLEAWYNGNGFASLPWTSSLPVGFGFNDPTRVKWGDISGDGRAELIYVETDGRLRSWYNGNGFVELPWTSEINIGTGFSDPKRVRFA